MDFKALRAESIVHHFHSPKGLYREARNPLLKLMQPDIALASQISRAGTRCCKRVLTESSGSHASFVSSLKADG